jgi:hypothetical protein
LAFFARVFLVDMQVAGGEAAERYASVAAALARDTATWHANCAGWADPAMYELLTSALAHACSMRIRQGRGDTLLELAERALQLHLAALQA